MRRREKSPVTDGRTAVGPSPPPPLWELPDMMSTLVGEGGHGEADVVREVACEFYSINRF